MLVSEEQGDVERVISADGTVLAAYTYDAWGNVLTSEGTFAQQNPIRYRGYYFDTETSLYYLQSRYYDPAVGRFINADGYATTGQGILGNNAFVYCHNSPTSLYDPTGEIAVTTLILIGSICVGALSAGYTAYKEAEAGYSTGRIIGDSLCNGFAAFSIVYSGGLSLYQCYQNYCYLNAITPITNIGPSLDTTTQLQNCANFANANVSGSGPVAGTQKHTVFAQSVNELGRSDLFTEISYKNGIQVPYGTAGSIRFDVLQYNSSGTPIAAWDFKTGSAMLTDARIATMQEKSGLPIPIFFVR